MVLGCISQHFEQVKLLFTSFNLTAILDWRSIPKFNKHLPWNWSLCTCTANTDFKLIVFPLSRKTSNHLKQASVQQSSREEGQSSMWVCTPISCPLAQILQGWCRPWSCTVGMAFIVGSVIAKLSLIVHVCDDKVLSLYPPNFLELKVMYSDICMFLGMYVCVCEFCLQVADCHVCVRETYTTFHQVFITFTDVGQVV